MISEQVYSLYSTIKDTIHMATSRKPTIYQRGRNYVALFWKIKPSQDSIYEMFTSKKNMEYYNEEVKYTFEDEYPDLTLNVQYSYGPVEFEDKMYSRLVYYYESFYDY